MTRRPRPTLPVELLPPNVVVPFLDEQADAAQKTLASESTLTAAGYDAWEAATENYITRAFGPDSAELARFRGAGPSGRIIESEAQQREQIRRRLEAQLTMLRAFLRILMSNISLESLARTAESSGRNVSNSAAEQNMTSSNKVFIVHGRDDGAKHAVARFLARLHLEPIILHEQANEGRTIIEKFEDHAQVAFAVVLLTPDDRGGLASEPYDKQQLRARQNVILELGYFLGKLGRKNVCALYKPGTDIPSDYGSVLFIQMDDSDGWHLKLVKELKKVLPKIDMNEV